MKRNLDVDFISCEFLFFDAFGIFDAFVSSSARFHCVFSDPNLLYYCVQNMFLQEIAKLTTIAV